MVSRTCSECAASLAGKKPQTKTCSVNCRQKRARRVRAAGKADGREGAALRAMPTAIRDVMLAVHEHHEKPDVIKDVMREQLAPIVRDALTESTLRAIEGLLGLTETAVQALGEDMVSDDPVIRQRAYALQMKYTIGHPALVQPEAGAAAGQMVVNFQLPRPDSLPAIEATALELKTCDLCGEEKPAEQFVGSSDRCETCQSEWKSRITDQFS